MLDINNLQNYKFWIFLTTVLDNKTNITRCMKIIQHFPYSVTLPEIIDRQRRGCRWVQEQSKRKRNNVELIFVFKYKVDIAGEKLSNFVSAINWLKTLSKGLKKAKLISLTTEERH